MGKKTKKVKISISGGIGNQLFILNYGLYLHEVYNFTVEFIVRQSGFGNASHGQDVLKDLNFDGLPFSYRTEGKIEFIFSRLCRLMARIPLIRSALWGYIRFYSENDGRVLKPREVKPKKLKAIYIAGYFQDDFYVSELRMLGKGLELVLREESDWSKTFRETIRQNPGVAIHVRRGDALLERNHGALSAAYYIKALARLRQKDESLNVYVFSDDIDHVQSEFRDLKDNVNFNFVTPPSTSSAAESLVLLSSFRDLVIGNSTFAWWAATAGGVEKRVMAPAAWKRFETSSSNLNSEGWALVEPEWIFDD